MTTALVIGLGDDWVHLTSAEAERLYGLGSFTWSWARELEARGEKLMVERKALPNVEEPVCPNCGRKA
jgi:hypothetical protein